MCAVSHGPQRRNDPRPSWGRYWLTWQHIGDSTGMALSIDELPNDIESLKALLLAAQAASQAAEAKSASLAAEVERHVPTRRQEQRCSP